MNMDIKELQNCVIAVAIRRKNDAKKRIYEIVLT